MTIATLYSQAPPITFEQYPINDITGADFLAIAGLAGKVVKVWRFVLRISGGSDYGFASSGGRVLLPPGGGAGGSTIQYAFQDFPPPVPFVPWVQTDVGEGLILNYSAGTANGIILATIENATG